jgi:hypothetical protein
VGRLAAALTAAAAALLLVLPSAHGRNATVVWTAPTKADRSQFTVVTGTKLTFTLRASTTRPDATVDIEPYRGLPAGATVSTYVNGSRSRAVFSWRPTVLGDYVVQFVASSGRGTATPLRTFEIHVTEKFPHAYRLTNRIAGKWAPVLREVAARAAPRASARVVARLTTRTPDETQNLVLVLEGLDKSRTETWYRVRLPILPNNSTGWVPARFLGELYDVHTHLYIDRTKLTATLERDGKVVFTARIGVGKPFWPTPPGEFYIRTKLAGFGDPFYGPVAFGTSARSAVLTDWPGGGFVGVHGTSLPELLPGQVSHGCIRMRNEDIVRLARLMHVGTQLTIR